MALLYNLDELNFILQEGIYHAGDEVDSRLLERAQEVFRNKGTEDVDGFC